MRFFFVDDSNTAIDDKLGFFVFGGLVVDPSTIRDLLFVLRSIKNKYGIPLRRPVKWQNAKWQGKSGPLDASVHQQMKSDVLKAVGSTTSRIIIYLAPHNFYHRSIAGSGDSKKQVIDPQLQIKALKFTFNVCFQKFNFFLGREKCFGIVLSDSFPDNIAGELLTHCYDLHVSGTRYSYLEKVIQPTIFIKLELSEMHQVNDIVLGAIQSSLKEISPNLLSVIRENFWAVNSDKGWTPLNYGINIYPKFGKTDHIRKKVELLTYKFGHLLNFKI